MTNGKDLVFDTIQKGALPTARAGETGSALMQRGNYWLSTGGKREDGKVDK